MHGDESKKEMRQECSKNQIGRKPTTQVRMRQKVTKLNKNGQNVSIFDKSGR